MAWRIVQQPNQLFAMFSEVVDNFTHCNMTRDEAIEVCKEEGVRFGVEGKIQRAIDNPDRFEEAIKIMRSIHGESAVKEFMSDTNGEAGNRQ